MTDPWVRFAERAARARSAGFFERRTDPVHGGGVAYSFTGADEIRPLGANEELEALARETDRFLRGGNDRAVIGYVGFDAVGWFEPRLARRPGGSPFPLGELALAERVEQHRLPPRRSVRPLARRLRNSPVEATLSRPAFEQAVRRLREAIYAGEAFQIVLAQRRRWPRPADLLERAGRLRQAEAYAYFYYLKLGDREIVGASPENVVELRPGRLTVDPIAGTVPRRWSARVGRRPLALDPKELAEHRMLVDLARNDLGRVARPGSVRLAFTERRRRYARVDHLVSRVVATPRRGVGPWEALAATFPAGTVSGAPKIRATELLRREERSWRGPYAGAVGLIRGPATADWALAIRTGFATKERLYTAAGAGIVQASRPRQEYDETLAKLELVEAALVGGAP